MAPDAGYKQRLDEIADRHLAPDPGQIVDVKTRSFQVERILPWVQGPEILEMGAGEVMWTQEVIAHFGHSSIVDGSSKLLANARDQYGEKLTIYESFFEDFLPPGGKRFDTVIATHVMEHVHDPVRVMKQARLWLRPRARMVVVVPNATSLHRLVGVKMGMLKTVYDFSDRDRVVGHQRVYDMQTLKAHVSDAGFRIVKELGFFLKLIPVGMMTGFSDALFKAIFEVADELPPEMAADIGLVLEAL